MDDVSSEPQVPAGWRQQCAQGHRSGLSKKCKLNNHGFTYISPDGNRFEDLESVYQFLYGARRNKWDNSDSPSLEEIDETYVQTQKRQKVVGNYRRNVRNVSLKTTNTIETLFKCNQCSFCCSSKEKFKEHVKSNHSKRENVIYASQPPKNKSSNVTIRKLDSFSHQKPEGIPEPSLDKSSDNYWKMINEVRAKNNPNLRTNLGLNVTNRRSRTGPPVYSTETKVVDLTSEKPDFKENVTADKLNLPSSMSYKIVKENSSGMRIILKPSENYKASSSRVVNSVPLSREPLSTLPPSSQSDQFMNTSQTNSTLVNIPKINQAQTLNGWDEQLPSNKVIDDSYSSSVRPEQHRILSPDEEERAQFEMLFLATPLKCYFCALGRGRLSKSDPAEFFHLQLEMNGQLEKGTPTDKDTVNLASFLRVNIGIAKKVLVHLGVSTTTRDNKNRLSFIRRICWDNMESLEDLCNSFERVWNSLHVAKDPFSVSQEVLGQVYRWKYLFSGDPYYDVFMSKIFIHIHQGQTNVYSFMRNKVVDVL